MADTLFLTLWFCSALATGPCVAVHPPPANLTSYEQCHMAGPVASHRWLRRHAGWVSFGGTCTLEPQSFRNEEPW